MAHGSTLATLSRPCDLPQNKSNKNGLKQGQILVKQTYWDYDDFMNPKIPNPPKKCYYKIMSKEEFCKRQEICKDLEQKRVNILRQIGDTSCNEMQKNIALGQAAACVEDISDDDDFSPYEDDESDSKPLPSVSPRMTPPHGMASQFPPQYRQNPDGPYPMLAQNQQRPSHFQSPGVANQQMPFQPPQQPLRPQQSTHPMPPPLPNLLEQPPRPRRCNINKRDLMPQPEFQFEKNNQHILQNQQEQMKNMGGRSPPSPCRARGGEEGLFSGGAAVADNRPCNCSRPGAVSRPPQDNSTVPPAQDRDAGQLRYPALTNKVLGVNSSRQPTASSCLKECNESNIPPLLPKYTTQLNSPQPEFKFNYMQCNPKSDSGSSSQEQRQSQLLNEKINPVERNPLNKPSPCRGPNTNKVVEPLGQKMGPETGSSPQNFLAPSLQNQQSKQYTPFQQNQPNKPQCCQPPKYNNSHSFVSNSQCSPCKLNNVAENPIKSHSQSPSPTRTADTAQYRPPPSTVRGNSATGNVPPPSTTPISNKCCSASAPRSNECCEIVVNTAECCSNPLRNTIECCEDTQSDADKCCRDQTPASTKCCENTSPQPEKCCGTPSSQNELSSPPSDECCGGQAEWKVQPSVFHPMTDRYAGSLQLNRPPRSAPTPGKSYAEVSPQSCCDSSSKNQCCAPPPNQQSTTYSPTNFQTVDVVEQSEYDDRSHCSPCQYEDQSCTDYPTGEEEEDCDSDDSEEDYCYDQNNLNEQEVCHIFDDYQDDSGGGGTNTCANEDICRCEDNMNNAFGCRQELQTSCNQGSGIPDCSNDKVQIIIQIPQQFSKNSHSSSYHATPQPFRVQMKSCQPRSQPYCLPSENSPKPSLSDRPPSEPCQPLSQIGLSSPSSPYQMALQPDPLMQQPCQPPPPPSQPYHLQSQPCQSPIQQVEPPLPPSEPCLLQSQPCPLSSPNCLRPLQPPSEPYQLLMKSYSPPTQPPSFQPSLIPSQLHQMQPYYQSQPYQVQSQPCQPPSLPFQSYQQQLQHRHAPKQQPLLFQKLKPQCQTFQPTNTHGSNIPLSNCPSAPQTSSEPFAAFQGVDNYNNNPVNIKVSEQPSVPASYWFPTDSPADMSHSTFDSNGNKLLVPRMPSMGQGGNTSPQNYPLNQSNFGGQKFSGFPLDNAGKVPFPDPGCSSCREKIQAKASQPPPSDILGLKSACGNCNATMNQLQNQCCNDNVNANNKNLCAGCDGSIR